MLELFASYVGNTVELFENGAFFEVMFEEIKAATRTVHFETFLWKEGVLGRRLVDALVERRHAGVKVRVLVDGDGGKKMGREVERQLTAAGYKFALHHPRHWRKCCSRPVVMDGEVEPAWPAGSPRCRCRPRHRPQPRFARDLFGLESSSVR
jgi:hypothetical protein